MNYLKESTIRKYWRLIWLSRVTSSCRRSWLLTDHVQLFNMSDIKQLSDTNRRQRFRDVDLARELIADEVDRFHQEIVENSLKSLFAESHREALDLAQKVLR